MMRKGIVHSLIAMTAFAAALIAAGWWLSLDPSWPNVPGNRAHATFLLLLISTVVVCLACLVLALRDALREVAQPPVRSKQEQHAYNTRLAWRGFGICLAGLIWLTQAVPPWNQPYPREGLDLQTFGEFAGFLTGLALVAILLVCLRWVVPSLIRWSLREINLQWEIMKFEQELADAKELERWQTPPPPDADWLEVSEPVKNALLDLTMGPANEEKPWPETLPPLAPAELAQRLRARVDQTLAQIAVIMNQSPQGEIPPAQRPRLRQLFKDLEHDILELGRQVRIEAAYNQLPPAEGHWAERYRQMKKETALGSHENPAHGSLPTNN